MIAGGNEPVTEGGGAGFRHAELGWRSNLPSPGRTVRLATFVGDFTFSEMATSFDVIVIGGGFAGLTAAVDLSARGLRVLVLEARPQLGGRATSFKDHATGEIVDNGQHVLFGCYRDTLRFLSTIGAREHVWFPPTLDVAYVGRDGRRTRLRCPPLPPPLNLLGGICEWEALSWRDRIAGLRMAHPLWRARRALGDGRVDAASARETVHDWLVRHGQTEAVREWLWEPLALAALNQDPRRAAAAPFARVLADLSYGQPSDAAVGLPARPLLELYGGPARSFIEQRGGEVRTDSPATLRLAAGGVVGIECQRAPQRGRRAAVARGELLPCRAVIAAVAWFSLPALVGDRHQQEHPLAPLLGAARQTDASPIVTVNLWFDRPVLDVPFIGLPGRTFQWVFQPSTLLPPPCTRHAAPGTLHPEPGTSHVAHRTLHAEHSSELVGPHPHSQLPRASALGSSRGRRTLDVAPAPRTRHPAPWVLHPAPGILHPTRVSLISSGADAVVERSNDELIAIARSEMIEAFPDVRAARLVHASAVREKRATFSVAPGQPSRPGTTTGVRGLFLAGDWIDTGLPGTIESAVTSGYWAAEAVIRALSR